MEYYNRKIKIVVHDQQELFQEGIISTLKFQPDFEVVGAGISEDLVSVVATKQPDILLMSLQSKETDTVLTANTITKNFPHVSILTISMFQQEQMIIAMLQAGVKGCLLRTASKAELLEAISILNRSGEYYSQEIINRLAHLLKRSDFIRLSKTRAPYFTEKERLFLHLLCRGYGTKEISAATHLSIRSVERKKEMLYNKVGIHSAAGLIRYAIEVGLYNPYEHTG